MRRLSVFIILSAFLIAASSVLMTTLVAAQDDGDVEVTITGTLNDVAPDSTIIVDGTTYRLASGVLLPPGTVIGAKVTLTGKVSGSTQVVVITVVRLTASTPTASPTATATAATPQGTATATANPSNVIIVIEGPVRARHDNFITIFDFNVQMAPDDPMLAIIKIGDVLHVKGNLDKAGVLVAIEVGNALARTSGGTALVEGRVQAINGNILTINGVNVQLAPDDPRLKTLHVGNFLSVKGNFERHGTTVVLIVVNIVVVNDADVAVFIYCREHKGKGMGMGMGMGKGMGMGGYDCRWP
jgi:hypothetical protein